MPRTVTSPAVSRSKSSAWSRGEALVGHCRADHGVAGRRVSQQTARLSTPRRGRLDVLLSYGGSTAGLLDRRLALDAGDFQCKGSDFCVLHLNKPSTPISGGRPWTTRFSMHSTVRAGATNVLQLRPSARSWRAAKMRFQLSIFQHVLRSTASPHKDVAALELDISISTRRLLKLDDVSTSRKPKKAFRDRFSWRSRTTGLAKTASRSKLTRPDLPRRASTIWMNRWIVILLQIACDGLT